jgi:hypothetical protein
VKTQKITAHLHDKTHVHHLLTASVICVIEIGLTVGVEIVAIHVMIAIALFGRDAVEDLIGD